MNTKNFVNVEKVNEVFYKEHVGSKMWRRIAYKEIIGSEKMDNYLFGDDVKKKKQRIELYQRYEEAIKANISNEGNCYIKAFIDLFINIMEDEKVSYNDIDNPNELYYIFKEKISFVKDDIEGFYHYYIWPGMQSKEHPLGSKGKIDRPSIKEDLIENRIGYIFYLCLKFYIQLQIILNDNSFEIVRPLKLYRGESEQYTFSYDKLKKSVIRIPVDVHSLFKNCIKQYFTSTAILDDFDSVSGFGYATHGLGIKIYVEPGVKILPTFYFSEGRNLLNDMESDEVIIKPGSILEKIKERNVTIEEFQKAQNITKKTFQNEKFSYNKKLENLYVHEYHYRDDSFHGSLISLFLSKLFQELFLDINDPMGFYQHVLETESSYEPKENQYLLRCLVQDCTELIKILKISYGIQ